MNHKDFCDFLTSRESEQLRLRNDKGKAYAGDGDVFANFKRNADDAGLSKYQVWLVYFGKHRDAIVNAIKQNPQTPVDKSEGMQGRIDDAINYLKLLSGMLEEDRRKVKGETWTPIQDIDVKLIEHKGKIYEATMKNMKASKKKKNKVTFSEAG